MLTIINWTNRSDIKIVIINNQKDIFSPYSVQYIADRQKKLHISISNYIRSFSKNDIPSEK